MEAFFQMENSYTKDYLCYDTTHTTFYNSHTCSPSTFLIFTRKCISFPLNLANSAHYSLYEPPPKCINHSFPMQLFQSLLQELLCFRGLSSSVFPSKWAFFKDKIPIAFLSPVFGNDWYMIRPQYMLNNTFSFLCPRFGFS